MADDDFDDDDILGMSANLASSTGKLTSGANGFGSAMTKAFASGIVEGKKFDDVLKSVGLKLSELSLKLALKPLEKLVSGSIDKLFASVMGGMSGGGGGASGFGGSGNAPVSMFADWGT